jgi:hypothetical protein
MLPTDAQADWRYRRHHGRRGRGWPEWWPGAWRDCRWRTCRLPAAYGYEALPLPPTRYRPAPVYCAPPPVVHEKQPVYCEWRRQKVWIDS